jgi:hypothetical protein
MTKWNYHTKPKVIRVIVTTSFCSQVYNQIGEGIRYQVLLGWYLVVYLLDGIEVVGQPILKLESMLTTHFLK